MRIAAVVLAAGRGRRAGGPKAMLPIAGVTFVEHVAGLLLRPGVAGAIVVLGHDADHIRATIRLPGNATLVVNDAYDTGMLGSILAGLAVAEGEGADAVLVHPVDHPLVAVETVDRVVGALHDGATIAVPSHGGRRGHPGGFARAAWPALRAASPAVGAREVLAAHPDWIVHVDGDPGCVAGVDTMADHDRLIR